MAIVNKIGLMSLYLGFQKVGFINTVVGNHTKMLSFTAWL